MYIRLSLFNDGSKYCVVTDRRVGRREDGYRVLARESPEQALRDLADEIEQDRNEGTLES